MSVQNYNINPALNITISGINVAEGCAAGNLNGAFRQMMADIKVMYEGLPSTTNLMPRGGGTFTGQITYTGRGGYLHHVDPAFTSGRVFVRDAGAPTPTMSEGDVLFELA